ncbi:hypothetical protein AFL22_22785 [Pantoea sp. CFSAN033090]|nr:hypothetical protein AFL22_22785 [Pantoea sp. CFSAN033090]
MQWLKQMAEPLHVVNCAENRHPHSKIRFCLFPDPAGCGDSAAGGAGKDLAYFSAVGIFYAKVMQTNLIESIMTMCKYHLP